MRLTPLSIPDVLLIECPVFRDARGFFLESWNEARFRDAGLDLAFVQDNHSRSVRGTLRGLHYQVGQRQGKLLRVTRGRVFDVAVDLRRSSPTFGRWDATILSDENQAMLWIPPGFAHGFYVLSECADFLYKCTAFYAPEHERCIRWDDPELDIDWPLLDNAPLLSPRDEAGLSFRQAPIFP